MNTAVINVRINRKVKMQAMKTADELGFSLSSLINGYMHHLIKTKTVFFSSEEPSKYLIKLIKQAEEDRKNGNYVSFKKPKEAISYLKALTK